MKKLNLRIGLSFLSIGAILLFYFNAHASTGRELVTASANQALLMIEKDSTIPAVFHIDPGRSVPVYRFQLSLSP